MVRRSPYNAPAFPHGTGGVFLEAFAALEEMGQPPPAVGLERLHVAAGEHDVGSGEIVAPCPEDVNNDLSVNVLDLIDVLLAFGTVCP